MEFTEINEEVLYTSSDITSISPEDISELKRRAGDNKRHKVRLCAHASVEDSLHEMIIALAEGAYVRPHKHIDKSESFHVIEGELKIVLFDGHGEIDRVVHLGDRRTGLPFYCRRLGEQFHTVLPVTADVVFHETTNGPFRIEDSQYMDGAPHEDDLEGQMVYLAELKSKL